MRPIAAHSRIWLYILGRRHEAVPGGSRAAVIGPMRLPAGIVTARFMHSTSPPGVRTRVPTRASQSRPYPVVCGLAMDDTDRWLDADEFLRRIARTEFLTRCVRNKAALHLLAIASRLAFIGSRLGEPGASTPAPAQRRRSAW